MKKLFFAAYFILTVSAAFSQTQPVNNDNNNHGQNDCQCIGIGIPNPLQNPKPEPTPVVIKEGMPSVKEGSEPKSLWYIYWEMSLLEMRNNLHNKGGN